MKVLMFGWEFPPHISGGLGTACAGLSHALEKHRVHVLFTIPKLQGGEKGNRITFINASAVPIRQKKSHTQSHSPHLAGARDGAEDAKPKQSKFAEVEERRFYSLIEVPSFLSAYSSPEMQTQGILRWNYAIGDRTDRTIPGNMRTTVSEGRRPSKQTWYVKEPYAFSGTYGSALFQEVERYGRVGGEIASRYAFDVIHAHDWMTFPAGMAAKKRSGKPLIVHVHATEIDRSGSWVNQQIFDIEKEGMQHADKVVTVSGRTKQIAVRHYQIDEDKIEVVHNGITPRDSPDMASFKPPIGAPVVTFLGRVTYQKGPMYFVEAARRVHEQFPDVHFVVAGSGDQLPQMIQRIAQVRLSGNFHFTGFLKGEDIDRIWAMSSVYVMPSVSEPFGIAPLEALQAGVPVILSRQAGVSEVMRHAIKVDFWDSEALADAICNVLRFKSLSNTLKKNGVEEIKTITWDKAAKQLTALYYELSRKHPKRKKSRLLFSGPPTPTVAHAALF